MSTNSYIGKALSCTDEVEFVYCHFDGYPSWVGKILNDYYATPELVDELIKLGDIYSLNINIAPKTNRHSLKYREDNTLLAYHRDLKEPWDVSAPKKCKLVDYFNEDFSIDYYYLYRNGDWYIHQKFEYKEWVKVRDIL